LIVTIFGTIFPGIGWYTGTVQHYRFTTYQPIDAQIASTRIESSYDKHGTHYEPVIAYSYTVNGVLYQSIRLSPVGRISGDSGWAHRIVAEYPLGSTTTAWYSPADPSSAFLRRETSCFPYIFALVPFAPLGLFLIFMSLHAGRQPPPPAPVDSGWFQVAEEGTLRGRFRISAAAAFGWYLYAALVLGDYLYLTRELDVFLCVVTPICILVGLAFLIPAWRLWKLSHEFLDADLRISHRQIRLGDTVQVKLCQPVMRNLQIEQLSLGLVCLIDDKIHTAKSTTYSTSENWSEWRDLTVNRFYQAGKSIDVEGHFTVPAEVNASSPKNSREYPYYRWYLALGVITSAEPKLTVYFPVRVEAS
jgi:hypothetical protein